jgi:SAM-dependent methyltransferase
VENPEPRLATPVPPGRSLYRKSRTVAGYTIRSLFGSTPLDFDRAHGVDTRDDISLRALLTEPIHDAHGRSRYWPITVKHFRFAMEHVPAPLDGWSFLDVGSGKGRAVLLAMGYPFRHVSGVELDEPLHGIAQANLRSYRGPRRCQTVELLCADATVAPLPPGDLVVFLYNSFIGESLHRFLDHLEQSLRRTPRRLLLIYSNPMDRAAVDGRPAFHLLFEGASAFDPMWQGVRRLVIYGAGTLAQTPT